MAKSLLGEFHDQALIGLAQTFPDLAREWSAASEPGMAPARDPLPDYSPDGVERRAEAIRGLLDQQSKLPAPATQEESRNSQVLSVILRHGLEPSWVGADGYAFRFHDYPINHFFGAQGRILELVTSTSPTAGSEGGTDYLDRLQAVPKAVDGLIASVRFRRERGIAPPRRLIQRVVDEMRALAAGQLDLHPILLSLRRQLSQATLSDAEKARIEARASGLVAGPVRAAYDRLCGVMTEQLSEASEEPGVCRLPEGEAYYDFLLRGHTTLPATAEEIHAVGREELAELCARIQSQFARLGLREDTAAGNFRRLLADKTRGYPQSDEGRERALADFRDALAAAESAVPRYFQSLPRAGVRLSPIAPAFEDSLAHHYTAPGRAAEGVFHVNLKHALAGPRWEVPAITFHETLPGHHLQIAQAREIGGLPFFRSVARFNAYAEGWAKYAETLPFEWGVIDDPYAAIGRLRMELYSTANLVLDTGVHSKGWSFAEGVSFLEREIGAGRKFATDLVDRVAAMPGQACAYKLGMMAMFRHRRRMERELGSAFAITRFHTLVLGQGSVPLGVLDQMVEAELNSKIRPQ